MYRNASSLHYCQQKWEIYFIIYYLYWAEQNIEQKRDQVFNFGHCRHAWIYIYTDYVSQGNPLTTSTNFTFLWFHKWSSGVRSSEVLPSGPPCHPCPPPYSSPRRCVFDYVVVMERAGVGWLLEASRTYLAVVIGPLRWKPLQTVTNTNAGPVWKNANYNHMTLMADNRKKQKIVNDSKV